MAAMPHRTPRFEQSGTPPKARALPLVPLLLGGIALAYIALFLLVPLVAVFYEA